MSGARFLRLIHRVQCHVLIRCFGSGNFYSEPLGNFYSEIVPTSSDAAKRMASRTAEIASEGAAFNKLFTNSTYPLWFQDFLINSLATQPKMGIWVRPIQLSSITARFS
jgi:uncharacterized protein (DUF608 family)